MVPPVETSLTGRGALDRICGAVDTPLHHTVYIAGPEGAALQKLTDHPSLQERAYEALRDAILRKEFEPGQRLLEVELAELLGISRSPVREAVRRLQQDGLIETRPRAGIFVVSITRQEIDDVFRIRAALEGTAAALAAQRGTEHEFESMEGMLAEMETAVTRGDSEKAIEESDRFHRAIHAAARSPRLFSLLDQIYSQVMHFRSLTLRVPGRGPQAARGHAQIVEALRARDTGVAENLMRGHIDEARLSLLRLLNAEQTPAGVG